MLTTQVQLIMPAHVNSSNRLFGGQLMSWIDVVAAVEARRHTKMLVITASVDRLEFLRPAFLGELIRLEAKVTWSGRSSLEVLVESYVESLSGDSKLVNRAFLVFVALDKHGNASTFPPYEPLTEEEREEWKRAEERRAHRLSLRDK